MKDYGFATYLLREGVLTADQHRAVTEAMGFSDRRADTVLLDLGLVSEATLSHALGRFHRSRPVTAVELAAVDDALARIISPGSRAATRSSRSGSKAASCFSPTSTRRTSRSRTSSG